MAHIKPEQLREGFYNITGSLFGTSSFALTASYALNAGAGSIDTGSLLITASAINDTITFTKGNGSTFPVTIDNVATASYALNALSSSYAATASYISTLYSSNYTQSFINQSTWTVTHNLNARYVLVQTYDTSYDEMIPQNIDLTDDNTVTISFPTLESGTAVVTVGGALQNSGGGGSITIPGNNTEILFNSASALGASSNFKFIYESASLIHGYSNSITGVASHAEGTGTHAVGDYSHAEGLGNNANGEYSHAEGESTSAQGAGSHTEGSGTSTTGIGAHAEGYGNLASGDYSHAEGILSTTISEGDHAEGYSTRAAGSYSHSEGLFATSSGIYSHAEGRETVTKGLASHAEGYGTIASGSYQHVQGRYNTQGDSTSLMIVGNGTSNVARKDAFKVRMSGSIVLPTTQSTAPSWAGTDGEIVPATIGGEYFLYMWMNGAWRSGSFV